jgi:hypothetical protein
MILTPKQIEYINNEKRHYIRLVEAKEKSKTYAGIGYDRTQLQLLQLIIDLHNIEINKDKPK